MIKMLKEILSSKEFRIGLGTGLVLASLLLWNKATLSDSDVEVKAREMGMKYETELRVGEVNGND